MREEGPFYSTKCLTVMSDDVIQEENTEIRSGAYNGPDKMMRAWAS